MTTARTGAGTDPGGHARVLAFQIGSLGDTVLSLPALHALRAHVGPAATITVLHDAGPSDRVAPTSAIPTGLVDGSLRFPSPESGPWHRTTGAVRLLATLRRRRYDLVVNLALAERSARSLRRDRAFFRLAGIGAVVGFDQVALDAGAPAVNEAQVRLDRLGALGISTELGTGPWYVADADAIEEAARWRSAAGLADRAIATVAPATLMAAKRWTSDRWVELGLRLRTELDLEPVVLGGPADRAEAAALVRAWGGGAGAAGALSPAGSAALAAGAAVHIGVDTGTTHLAAAAGTPVVALYSHRAPIERWAPLGADRSIVHHPVPCAGCEAVDCPVAGHPCMDEITVEQVWARVVAALDQGPGR